ncbi:CAP-Gly domain-containing linker protein 1-like isoform X2 [Limulus polyphemus]|uniref:CAP-Gly domain-containing linker protein 1-like isoform X2 n=1 Tax=Limulus polyphemus TaxID=6850 RepID=A0ABM1SVW3_LIMPO|nr:CAP-Gly domain-containing linker protein 1-like isoform X2 [Limulus polyphemus]
MATMWSLDDQGTQQQLNRMSQRSSGIKAPTKIAKPTTLPTKTPTTGGTTPAPPHTSPPSIAASADIRSDISDIFAQSTEDFTIGDKIWVNGNKSGYIQYLGETQFAPGQWAGVVLDEPLGKNDGSVGSIRYFQCEPNRGVFVRPYKLSHFPTSPNSVAANDAMQLSLSRASTTHSGGILTSSTTQLPCSSPVISMKDGTTPPGMSSNTTPDDDQVKVGDRVVVNATSGIKIGTLRYLGTTEFAMGQWAGIELDEPQGKNDGSVAGKRYFECVMKYGLFAPIHKLTKAVGDTSIAHFTSSMGPLLQHRTGSHESLISSISSTSSAACGVNRVRLEVTSPTSPQRSSHPSATNNALQEALKEKEDHIEQLLRERDLERAEVARAAGQADKAEQKLAALKIEHQRYVDETQISIIQLHQLLEKAHIEKKEALAQLDDEKRKVEDLQFRIEEESIDKIDLETQSKQEKEKILELERLLHEERQHLRTSDSSNNLDIPGNELLNWHEEEIENLKQNISKVEEKINLLKVKRASERVAASELHEDIVNKDEIILQLEASLENREREVSDLQKTMTELGEDLEQGELRQQKHLQITDESGRKLYDNEEKERETLQKKVELENREAELIRISRDDNSLQPSQMNQEIRDREKQVEELQIQLRGRSQELEKLKDIVNSLQDKKKQEFYKFRNKRNEEVKDLKSKMKVQHEELQKTQENISNLTHTLAGKEQLVNQKETEAEELRQQLEESESQLAQSQAQLQEIQLTVESLQAQTSTSNKSLEIKVQHLQKELDQVKHEKEKVFHKYHVSEKARIKLQKQLDEIMKEKQEHQATVSDRDAQVAKLKAEVGRLQTEFAKHKEELQRKLVITELESQAMQDLHNQFNLQQDALSELQNKLVHVEAERDELYREVLILRGTQEERNQLESRSTTLQQHLGDLKQSECKSLKKNLESTQSLLDGQENSTIKKGQELVAAKEDKTYLQNCRFMLQNVEQQKEQLKNKIMELQLFLARSQANEKVEDMQYKQIKEDKEALQIQIEFLNSVIVDMQTKNDELRSRVKSRRDWKNA